MAFHAGVDWELLLRFLFALGIGALIGLERERHREQRAVLAGVRTFPLVALSGVLLTEISSRYGEPVFVALGTAILGGFSIFMYYARQKLGDPGLTSPIALFVTYLIGILVGFGLLVEATVAGVATTVLLFTRERLHRVAEVMTEREMQGALYFVIVAFILYPLAPSEPVDPWGLFNPAQLILIVILVSLMSFVGFLALRAWGASRGLALSGLFGGLANSEAATVSIAATTHERPEILPLALRAILLATSTMFVRNLAIAGIADPSLDLVRFTIGPLGVMALVAGTFAVLTAKPAAAENVAPIRLGSPFALLPAFRFALLFAAASLVGFLLTQIPGLGSAAVYLTALGGLVSAGAVVASMGVLAAHGSVPVVVAGTTAVLACVLSALNKPFLARTNHRPLAQPLTLPIAATAGAGIVLLLVVRYLVS